MKLAQYIYIYIYSGISILSNSPETNRVPCHLAGNERYPRARGGNSFIHPAPRVEIFPRCAQFSTEKSARNDVLQEGVSDYSRGLPFALQLCQNPLYSPLDATIMLYYSVFVSILYTRGLRCLVHLLLLLHFEKTFFTNLPS